MFRGRHEHTIDPKGRVSIPVKFREVLGKKYDERLVITNFDGCLVAYPYEEWIQLEEKAGSLSMVKKETRSFMRFFYSSAIECTLDKQGRILIPQTLREYAALDKEVVLVGQLKKIEIWSKKRWSEEIIKAHEDFDRISDVLSEFGL
ncbi:MAG: division/cell wall cluster transcriptional repressor MraZ [Syntrophobacterales bacterium]|nr:MAG: division/cell wall cluster transcriptional repressor MraZ [Syntrophobacterales bacterium]